MVIKKQEFNLEHQFQLYLKRVALDEKTMPEIQSRQLRQAFMGACGQMLILLRDDLGAIEKEMDAIDTMQDMIDQVGKYFLSVSNRQN